MQFTKKQFLNIEVLEIEIDGSLWYQCSHLLQVKPSVFIKQQLIPSSQFLKLTKAISPQSGLYFFSVSILIKIISHYPSHSYAFVEFFLTQHITPVENKTRGRKRKKFDELTSKSTQYDRKKEIELNFLQKNQISIYDYMCSEINYKDIKNNSKSDNLYSYLFKCNSKNKVDLLKVPISDICLAKDKTIISYIKLNTLRITIGLQKIIPCTSTILKYVTKLNKKISERYCLINNSDCCAIGNINVFLKDYCLSITKLTPDKKNYLMKWTCDQRNLLQSIGDVGFAVQVLEESDNQLPEKQIYLCIGNGKENKQFFQKNLLHLKKFCSQNFVDDKFIFENYIFESFFLADLKHIWENSHICKTTRSNEEENLLIENNFHLLNSSLTDEELIIYEHSQSEHQDLEIELIEFSDKINDDHERDIVFDEEILSKDFESDGICQKCPFCGKLLKEIRAKTRAETVNSNSIFTSVEVRHWIGIRIKYFCILHCSQRCTERIFFLFALNDKKKIDQIEKILKEKKIMRDKWGFKEKYNRWYPQMIFGTEVDRILNNIDEWFTHLKWLTIEDKLIIDQWAEIYKLIHMKSCEIQEINQWEPIQSKIDQFISNLIRRFGRESVQFYFHFIDYHFVEIIKEGLSLCVVQNQGLEKSHSIHKLVQMNMTSNESGFHKTPSFTQIMMRQLRIFVLENKIFDGDLPISNELEFIINGFVDDPLFDLLH